MSVAEILFWLIIIFLVWQVTIRAVPRIHPFPAPAFIGKFLDSDVLRRIQPPGKVLTRSRIKKGMTVLEIGCGSCCYMPFTVKTTGQKGKVVRLDIQREMLDQ
ncbi:protein-L-isoaspartate O-methyltransferase [Methanomicrobium sp. W14]|uniref:hypothetical protein n=1 Tax=Methanomicrobium sp. W14 TaxID=2817839 RepID=UPI001AEB274F|nr:hypothetical protein [Methanomicrobium sp. W14]MBP2133704.1 protein-L-isoaspartate O-methyltransferase [Methanomicrobium sp. W14]